MSLSSFLTLFEISCSTLNHLSHFSPAPSLSFSSCRILSLFFLFLVRLLFFLFLFTRPILRPAGLCLCYYVPHLASFFPSISFLLSLSSSSLPPSPPVFSLLSLPFSLSLFFSSFSSCSGDQVFAWGWNACGQLGLGTFDDAHRPQPVDALRTLDIVSIAAGAAHNCAIIGPSVGILISRSLWIFFLSLNSAWFNFFFTFFLL